MPLADALAERDGVFGAAVDIALLTRLDLKVGDRIDVGTAPIEIRAVLRSEPDKLAGGIGFGPRLLISIDALRATGLLQPGSLVRWLYRVQLPDNDATDRAAKTLVADAEKQLPEAGWEIRSRDNASPQLERNIERFTQFLTLVGLTALAGRRRRRRQCGAQPSRPQARHHRHHEIARRDRRARLCDLSGAGDDDRRDRHR